MVASGEIQASRSRTNGIGVPGHQEFLLELPQMVGGQSGNGVHGFVLWITNYKTL